MCSWYFPPSKPPVNQIIAQTCKNNLWKRTIIIRLVSNKICQIAIVHFKMKICLSISWGQLVPSCRSGVTCREYFLSHCLLKWSARFLHSPDPPALRRATGEYIEHGVWSSGHVASGDACPEVLSLTLGVLAVNPAKYWSHPDEFLSFWHLWSTSFSFASL